VVFQFFNLLPSMTVEENVGLPLWLAGELGAGDEVRRVIELVGLAGRRFHFPHQLSGGEMQRAAIARALVHRPPLLLADEPTGNLDSANQAGVLEVLRDVWGKGLATVVVVTHSAEVAAAAGRRVGMRDGRIVADDRLAGGAAGA
jgi:putative ABC transport system ATP-binding protein